MIIWCVLLRVRASFVPKVRPCLFEHAAVTKALREVAESKARASNEAAAWKLKYEMERLRTFRLEQTHQEHCQSSPGTGLLPFT